MKPSRTPWGSWAQTPVCVPFPESQKAGSNSRLIQEGHSCRDKEEQSGNNSAALGQLFSALGEALCKLTHTCTHLTPSKVMFTILQARLQQFMSWEFPDLQAGLRKSRGTRDPIANICWIIEKAREFQKNIYSASFTMLKSLTLWITTDCGKFLKRWEYQTTLPASWKICMQVKKQQLELDMEQWTGFKLGKEYVKAVYITLLI